METRANPLTVGLFALAVIAAAFGFIIWMGSYGTGGGKTNYQIVFQGEVTGLTQGGSVLYNGIRVGEVVSLGLAQDDPSRVAATVRVDNAYPVTDQTTAQLQFQMLSGVAYVQLLPAEKQAGKPLPPGGQIRAERSDFQDFVSGGQSLLTKLDSIADKIDTVLVQNEESVQNTIRNVEAFTQALADNSDNVSSFLADASSAARQLSQLGGKLGTLSDQVQGVVAAIEPDDVRQVLSDARTFSGALARSSDRVDEIADNAVRASERLNTLAADLEGSGSRVASIVEAIDPERLSNTLANIDNFSGEIASAGTEIGGLIADARGATQRIDEVGNRVNTLVAALEPARISNTIANAESFTAALARNGENLDGLMADARTTVQEFGAAGSQISALSDNLNGVVSAVDPQEVETVVANVRRFTDELAANADKVTQIADSAVSAADRIDRVSARIDAIGAQVNEVVGAVSPEKVAQTLTSIETFSGTLARNSEDIDAFITNARAAAESVTEAGNRIAEASASARQVIDAVEPEQIRAVMGDVRNFTDMLSTNREAVATFLQNAAVAAQDIGSFAGRAEELTAAIDPTSIQRSITNFESFTVSLASKTQEVESFIDDASAVASQLRETSTKLDTLLTRANTMLEGNGDGFFEEATAAARSIRQTADSLNSRIDGIAGDIQRYGTGGLRDFQQLMQDGRQTLSEVERLIRNVQQNPAGFLSGGGSQVQEYNPGRRF